MRSEFFRRYHIKKERFFWNESIPKKGKFLTGSLRLFGERNQKRGFFSPTIFQIAPSSVSCADSYSLRWLRIGLNRTVPRTVRPPRGSLRALLRCGFCYGSFLHKPHRLCQSPSPGGEGGPALRAGSDEGGPGGFLGVGNRRTGLRWQRDSSTHRYSRSPPHQSPSVPASPRGEACVLCYVGVIATVFFYISHAGFANRLPLGGRWADRRPGRMRASLEDSSAWVAAPPTHSPKKAPSTWAATSPSPDPEPPCSTTMARAISGSS